MPQTQVENFLSGISRDQILLDRSPPMQKHK